MMGPERITTRQPTRLFQQTPAFAGIPNMTGAAIEVPGITPGSKLPRPYIFNNRLALPLRIFSRSSRLSDTVSIQAVPGALST